MGIAESQQKGLGPWWSQLLGWPWDAYLKTLLTWKLGERGKLRSCKGNWFLAFSHPQTTGLLCNQHDFQSHLTTHTHFPPNTSELRTWHRVMVQVGGTLGDKEQRVRSKWDWVSEKKGNTRQRPTQRMKSLCKKASCKQPSTSQPSPKIKTRQAWTFNRLLFGLTLKNSDSNSHLQGQGSLQIFVDTCCKYLRYNHYHSEVRHPDTGWPSLSSHPKCSGIY